MRSENLEFGLPKRIIEKFRKGKEPLVRCPKSQSVPSPKDKGQRTRRLRTRDLGLGTWDLGLGLGTWDLGLGTKDSKVC